MPKHILFLVPYPEGEAPSQRFRFEQYLPILKKNGFQYTIQPFLSKGTWRVLYKKGSTFQKAWGIFSGFWRRTSILFKIGRYDLVFIHREASPIGPPLFEWMIARIWKKPLIYDFDDAIWLPNTSRENKIAASLKFHSKTASICSWSQVISCGNQFLADYAKKHSSGRVVVNPTTIDTKNLHNQVKDQETNKVVIGWTGTHSTLKYLKLIEPALHQIASKFPQVEFQIISNQSPDDLPGLPFRFVPWNKKTEIEDLLAFHIGLMPLAEDQWSAGKCGFKALQYMALGIPPVASPVGVNTQIIQHGRNGFLADSQIEWQEALEELIVNREVRKELGKKTRQAVRERFSVEANTANFLALFSLAEAQSTTRAAP